MGAGQRCERTRGLSGQSLGDIRLCCCVGGEEEGWITIVFWDGFYFILSEGNVIRLSMREEHGFDGMLS